MLNNPDLNINQLEPKYFSLGLAGKAANCNPTQPQLDCAVNNPYYVPGGQGFIGNKTVSQAQLLRPFPAFANINIRGSDQNKDQYDSLVVKAQKRYSAGLTFRTAYTWSKNLDPSAGRGGSDVDRRLARPRTVHELPPDSGHSMVDSQ